MPPWCRMFMFGSTHVNPCNPNRVKNFPIAAKLGKNLLTGVDLRGQILASKKPQIRVSDLTRARALTVQEKFGTPMGFQLDRAHEMWLKQNHPEIISSVTAAPSSETPDETEGAKPKARKPRKK